jgi:hypothetical protein
MPVGVDDDRSLAALLVAAVTQTDGRLLESVTEKRSSKHEWNGSRSSRNRWLRTEKLNVQREVSQRVTCTASPPTTAPMAMSNENMMPTVHLAPSTTDTTVDCGPNILIQCPMYSETS